MNVLWSPPSVCSPAVCVMVVVLVVLVLVKVELVGVGLPVVVVAVVVGGFLLPPPMVLPSLTAAKGSGFGGGDCRCCWGAGSEAAVFGGCGWFPRRGRPSSSGCRSGCAPGLV